LKGENRYIDDLVKMVGELYRADHYDEADAFLKEINAYLRSIGEEPVEVALWGKAHKFPAECPHCGGQITYRGNQDETPCPFCQTMVAAIS
jgi:hypothetical protein